MKIPLKASLAILLLLASCKTNTPSPIAPTPEPEATNTLVSSPTQIPLSSAIELSDIPWEDRSIFSSYLISEEKDILDDLEGRTVYHIEVTIPDDMINLTGHQDVLYTNLEDQALDEIYFRLYPNIFSGEASLSSITLNGEEVIPAYELAESAARLTFPEPLQPKESVVIGMDFKVRVPTEASGNYGLFGYIDGILVLHKFYPVIPVYDDEGWNVEIPPTHGDVSYFDASFYIVQVTAPEDLIVATSGVEVERALMGSSK